MHIFTAPSSGAEVQPHNSLKAIAGKGLVGDCYAELRGFWSADVRKPQCEVTLIEDEGIKFIKTVVGKNWPLQYFVETSLQGASI